MSSTQITNATSESRVTYFAYQRNLADNGGVVNWAITNYIASNGSPVPGMSQQTAGMHPMGAAEATQCPGAANTAAGMPALTDPVTGTDLSTVSNAGMVLIVERICQLLAAQQASA